MTEPTSPKPSPHRRINRPITIIALSVIAAAAIIAGLYVSGSPYSLIPVTRPPSTVRVSGNVWAVRGIKTSSGILAVNGTSIKFTSITTSQTFTTSVSQVDSAYAIDLPNQQTFRVTISWSAQSEEGIQQSGTSDKGTLTVNIGTDVPATMSANFLPV